ncbi:MAG: nucleotidyltransferase domain-containing protein [Treponema sp.]|jgi:predicted nucleotidyltransferase|nr:nucleotidyltransferase domain-containing protein [Treponema sp.]
MKGASYAPPINDEILAIKDTIVKTVDPEKVYLFGSYAYGTPHKDSDYDFYVILKDDSAINPLDAMDMIEMSLFKTNVRKPTDILANYKSSFEYISTQPTMERKIVREGVLLHERH